VIFLILKMFVYLLLALAAGVGAGWVLRHIAAAKQEEDMQRTLADARARVPQFESLIRSRDEQIKRLKEELKEKDVRINGLADDVREAELSMKDKDRELKEFTARHETLADLTDEPAPSNDSAGEVLVGGEILEIGSEPVVDGGGASDSALQSEITRLEGELREARSVAADAMAEAAAAEAEVITLKAELARAGESAGTGSSDAVADLESRLKQKSEEHDRLARELESEQRRVTELERERELQNKSLRVLHQQLELEKERGQRAAAG
jgi:predicted RNase H-like nuclease (RuvC/YqgF family)